MAEPKSAAGAAPQTPQILDLSKVELQSPRTVPPRISVHYAGYVGNGSALAAVEVKKAAEAQKLDSPLPAALTLYPIPDEASAVRAVPVLQRDPAYLNLDWVEQGRHFRTNLKALLQMKQIRIPDGTRFVIQVSPLTDPELGPCLRLSWSKESFLPVHESPADEESHS